MSGKFSPLFSITPAAAKALMRIEGIKQAFSDLPITPQMLVHLRETARLFSTHYSTMIEGNRLTQAQVAEVIEKDQHFLGRERDQSEVKGYYAALDEALGVGPSHNYYMGRAQADLSQWVTYFTEGMAQAFEKVRDQALREQHEGRKDQSKILRTLDAKQRKALALFQESREIGAKDVAALFGYAPRTASQLCKNWVEAGFLQISCESRKTRRYRLTKRYESLMEEEN